MKQLKPLPPSVARWAIVTIAGLAAWPAASAFHDHEPFAVGRSVKPVQEIAGCFALVLARSRGIELDNREQPDGIDLAIKMRAAGLAITNTVYEIRDKGDHREVAGYVLKRPKTPRGPLAPALAKCI